MKEFDFKNSLRKINFFEKVILVVGLGVGVVGFFLIKGFYMATGQVVSWDMISAIILWLLLIIMLILTATMEDVKEELAIVIKEGIEETRLMKEEVALLKKISSEQLVELKLLGRQLAKGKK